MLYCLATPIGNLGDITLRTIDILEKLDILLCENTRTSHNLLTAINVKNKPSLVSFYDEIEEQKIPQIISWLKEGKEIGLLSNAGTPLISDPGGKLIKRCQKSGIKYTAVPGPCALINALVLSGLPPGRFSFLGFLPKKSQERKKVLRRFKAVEGSKVVYEAPRRVKELVTDIKEIYGQKTEIRICREMTKKFEEVSLGLNPEVRGEVTVVFI